MWSAPLDFCTPKFRYPLFGTNIDGTENWVPSITVPRFGYRQKRYPKPGTVKNGTQFKVFTVSDGTQDCTSSFLHELVVT